MVIVTIIRIVIWLTFLYLVVGSIVSIIVARKFYIRYIGKHLELEKRVEAVEKRLGIEQQA